MTIMFLAPGVPLFVAGGLVGMSPTCCCGGEGCCGCARLVELHNNHTDLIVEFSGAAEGSGTTTRDDSGTGHCLKYQGFAGTIDSACTGDLQDIVDLVFRCLSQEEGDYELTLSNGGAGCAYGTPELVSVQCDPFRIEWTVPLLEVAEDGCDPCDVLTDTITVVIREDAAAP